MVAAVFIHGTEDGLFPWFGRPDFLAPEEMLLLWAELSGCTLGLTVTPLPDVMDDGRHSVAELLTIGSGPR